jgi:4-hydroxy-tetrahydrodipicolinate synthase
MDKINIDLRGLNPAPVTPFNRDGSIDFAAIKRLGSWLAGIDGVKSLTVLGHAGEGTYLDREEQVEVIRAFVEAVDNRIPIIAGITLEEAPSGQRSKRRYKL